MLYLIAKALSGVFVMAASETKRIILRNCRRETIIVLMLVAESGT